MRQSPRSRPRRDIRAVPLVEAVEPRVLFATFTVSSIADAGAGSFRQAITSANTTANIDSDGDGVAEQDLIVFNLATGSTITPATALPTILQPVLINLEAANPDLDPPTIILNGANAAGSNVNGLTINTSVSAVSGLVINRFSGNGIAITGSGNFIDSTKIGAGLDGTTPLGNLLSGVSINGSNNAVSNSTVAFNGGDGITIAAGTGNELSIQGAPNGIFSNGDQAIDLGNNGVTPNDAGDGDAGANGLQNFPVLSSVNFADGNVTVSGTINTAANTVVSLQFYANPTASREGRVLLVNTQLDNGGEFLPTEVTTGASGNAAFTFTLRRETGALAGSNFVAATATPFVNLVNPADPEDDLDVPPSTSEFSAPLGAAAAPRVQQVYVNGTGFTATGRAVVAAAGQGNNNGFAIPGGAAQLAAVPYGTINQVRIQFTENVAVDQADLAIRGVNQATYTTSGFAYDANTFTATWTLPANISRDKILLDLNGDAGGGVTDNPGGNLLDGEWANGADSYPSGNGAAGGDFRFQINVLPGDANGSGTADVTDLGTLSTNFNKRPRGPRQGDFNGDGGVDVTDLGTLSTNFNKSLPAGTPTLVASPSLMAASRQIVSRSTLPSLLLTGVDGTQGAPRQSVLGM